MELKFQCILAFLSLALVASHATLPSEEYWNSVLPNSPMPKVVNDLLHPVTGQGKPGSTNVNVGLVGFRVKTRRPNLRTSADFGNYNNADAETQLLYDPDVAIFFLEKDLSFGKKMNLQFSKITNDATFLPREVAHSIPFSSNKLPEILNKFSVKPGSEEAAVIQKTIKECEEKSIKGEEKFCATSLESMVDFSTSKLGKDVEAISTNAEEAKKEEYRIVGVKKAASKKPLVACHRQEYAYAVFYCHTTYKTVAYKVEMVAADGSKAEAVAVCHRDTAAWNPKHLAFQVLKVKPGTVPVCHFLPEDHIVWVSKY